MRQLLDLSKYKIISNLIKEIKNCESCTAAWHIIHILHETLTLMFTNACKVTTFNVLIYSPGNSSSSMQKLSVGIKVILISPVSLLGT